MIIIFYADGSTYQDGPANAPKVGVIAIVQPNGDSPGHHVIQKGDFYLWREDWHGGMWQAADRDGKETYMRQPGWKVRLCGESVPNDVYEEITQRALAQRDLLNKV